MKIICIFLLSFHGLLAQNLISNADFNFENNWDSLRCIVIEKADMFNRINMEEQIFYDKYIGYVGDFNVGTLFYIPNCNCLGEGDYIGCANYLYQKIQSPLKIGTMYKVSFKVLFLKIYEIQEAEALKHAGVLLSNKPPYFRRHYDIVEKNAITVKPDEAAYHQWIHTEVFIIPTCELNYITVGLFKESNWIPSGEKTINPLVYFVDDISVEPVKETKDTIYKAQYYCNEVIKPNEINNLATRQTFNFYYDTNSSQVKSQSDLDSFAHYASTVDDLTFYVTGHTDSKGIDNYNLSKKRVDSLVTYLTQVHKLQKYRFIKSYLSEDRPVASNNTEEGRALNRRVNITPIALRKSNACYREALRTYKESKNLEETFRMLFCWGVNEVDGEKILIYFDPQWDAIKQDKRWKKVEKLVRDSYARYQNPTYSFLLDSLYCEDQKYRRLQGYVQDLAGYFKDIDTSLWTYPQIDAQEWDARDSLIHKHLTELIQKYGYPKLSEVGERSAKAAAVIMIHQGDKDEIRTYLPILEKLCIEGEGDWAYYATMYDKLCVLEEIPQRYGTQFVQNDENVSELVRYKTEGREIVNEHRRKVALVPLSEEEFNVTLNNSN